MPISHRLVTCRECGQEWVTGDCILDTCPSCECARLGHRKIAGIDVCGRCGERIGEGRRKTQGDQAMDFTEACGYEIPFGKFRGMTLADIGSDEDGLRYLDWLIGQEFVYGRTLEALETYLGHPVISRQLDAALED